MGGLSRVAEGMTYNTEREEGKRNEVGGKVKQISNLM